MAPWPRFVVCSLGLAAPAALAASPVWVGPSKPSWAMTAGETALYKDADLSVYAQVNASPEAFTDLYVVNMTNRLSADSLLSYGELLHLAPARFALMKLSPTELPHLASKLHREGLACGSLVRLDLRSPLQAEAAPAVPLLATDHADPRVERLTKLVDQTQLRGFIEALTELPTRFPRSSSGQEVAALLASTYERLKGSRTDVTVRRVHHVRTGQDSLIVRIEGTQSPAETVILGSHLDSVNWQGWGGEAQAPGADDNASGTATNLEIFRLLMSGQIHPRRTIEIHAYAAEELGLVGSGEIAKTYRQEGRSVISMVQYDMDLYTADGEERRIWLVNNNTTAGLNQDLGRLIDHYVGLPWQERYLGAGSSDHASWFRAGFATAFPFEHPDNYNHSIHTEGDDLAASGDFTLATGFAKLGLAYTLHFAGFDEPGS